MYPAKGKTWWAGIVTLTDSEHRGSQIFCTIKKPLAYNRKSATEGVPLRYFSF